VLFPQARVLTAVFVILVFFVRIPAVFFLGFWIVFQAWQGGLGLLHPSSVGGVAFFAHIGGFAFGLLTVKAVVRRQRPLAPRWR
jgi:rhomboid family protein